MPHKIIQSLLAAALLVLTALLIALGQAQAQTGDEPPQSYLPIVMREHDAAWRWLPVETLTPAPNPNTGDSLLLAIDNQGQTHLLWDTLYSPRFIYHSYQAGGAWTPPAPISETLGTSYTLYAPLRDAAGRLHLVWRTYLGSGIDTPYRLMYAVFDGASWKASEIHRTANSGIQGMPHSDDLGGLRITYLDSSISAKPAYQVARTSGGWSFPWPINPTQSVSLVWPDMQGGVRFYDNDYSGLLHYTHWKNGAFLINDLPATGKVSSRQSQLDGQNNLQLFWSGTVPVPGGNVTGMHHQCFSSALAMGAEQVLSGETAITGSPRAGSDGVSRVVIAWKQNGADLLWLTIWDGCRKVKQISAPLGVFTDWSLQAAAISHDPRKVCVLAKKLYSSDTFALLCAEY